jgi:hypothetical protein
MADLSKLADQVQARAEPDRVLDAAIHEAVTTFPARHGGVGWPEGALVVPMFPGWGLLPTYTESINDALTLALDDWWFDVRGINGKWSIVDYGPHTTETRAGYVQAATPALALCAAALRARAQSPAPLQQGVGIS